MSTPQPGRPSADPLAHADALYNLARYLTGNRADAEDLVQETYARAYRALQRFAPGTDLKAWLFRILRNAFLDVRRRSARSPIDEQASAEGDADAPAAGEDAWLRGDADLERMRGLVGAEIEAALASLQEDSRTIVLLDLEGFTEAEVAAVMGCPTGTVKSRLSRARSVLRERLADYRR